MSDIKIGSTGTINTADRYILNYPIGRNGTVGVQFDFTGWSGSGVVVQGRFGSDAPWLPIPYVRLNVAGVASDLAVSSAAIAADGAIQIIIADGMEIAFDVTGGWAAGSAGVWVKIT